MDVTGFLAPLPIPTVPEALPNIPGGEDNLLPREAWQKDLKITFPLWGASDPRPGLTERVDLKWDGRKVAEKSFSTPITDPDSLFAHIPVAELSEGVHRLFYEVYLADGNYNYSDAIDINIDKTPPILAGNKDPLVFLPDLIGNKVTARYLETHGNMLPATVPDYITRRPGDVISWYWEQVPVGSLLAGDKTLSQDDMSLQIEIDGDFIVASGDGERYATYEVQDRAGNLSVLSRAVMLTVDAQPVPLLMPSVKSSVPSGGGKGTLDPLLVTEGAVVVVPAEIDLQPTDLVTVYWGGAAPDASHETTVPTEPGGREYLIPARAVPGNIGSGREVEVYYTVKPQSGNTQTSATYFLTILAISEFRFPKPQCDQASGTPATLRLSAVPGGADFSITPWAFMAVGQKMHMWAEGVDKNTGADLYFDLFKDRQVTAGEVTSGVYALLARSFLEQLKLNAVFWVDIEVSFDGGLSYLGFRRQDLTLVV
ncbi:hypothetical protein K5D56_20975 [Pseudomonas cichorii]|nr:hypothetical protein [Pseudomonas cichorii]MBX8492237.1 hypothetical protein [Pseudomonas cichorii]MBX8522971.1 hypothetical protein [Pseudomonas cichorii]MBX8571204.1 hypothetical protein [Pseudomonas cichorii]MBX8591844.1 hypothetical protein [Pseudomonas cichorii]MBX8600088.1 hypothetical protein [Pseudomonas cichorii]